MRQISIFCITHAASVMWDLLSRAFCESTSRIACERLDPCSKLPMLLPDWLVVDAESFPHSERLLHINRWVTYAPRARTVVAYQSHTSDKPLPELADFLDLGVRDARPIELIVPTLRTLIELDKPASETATLLQIPSIELSLDIVGRTCTVRGTEVHLTAFEWVLLETFLRSPKTAYSRERLMNILTGTEIDGYNSNVDPHVGRINGKLGRVFPKLPDRSQRVIQTVWAHGYRLRRDLEVTYTQSHLLSFKYPSRKITRVVCEGFEFDVKNQAVLVQGQRIAMGQGDYRLLEYLVLRPGVAVSLHNLVRSKYVGGPFGVVHELSALGNARTHFHRAVCAFFGTNSSAEQDIFTTIQGYGYKFNPTYWVEFEFGR